MQKVAAVILAESRIQNEMAFLETPLPLGFPVLHLFLRNEFLPVCAASLVQMHPSWSWD